MIPTSTVVNLTISVTPQVLADSSFSTTALIGESTRLPTGKRFQPFTVSTISSVFAAGDPEAIAATPYFAQNPNATLLIGRRFAAATAGELIGGSFATLLAGFVAVNDGSLKFNLDGSVIEVVAINLTTATTLNQVAQLVQTALDVSHAGVKVTFNGSTFYVQSGTTGASSQIGYSVAATPGAGIVDIGPLMGLTQASVGSLSTNGVVAESITTSLNNLLAINNNWYGLSFTNEVTDPNIEEIGAWSEINERDFVQTTSEQASYDPTSTTDIGAVMNTLGYTHSAIIYDPLVEYSAMSYLGKLMTTNFEQSNGTFPMMFKTEPGITPSNLNGTQSAVLDTKKINYYNFFGTTGNLVSIIARGVQSSGMYSDTRIGLDWLKSFLQTTVFNYLLTNRVQQTDKGVASIVHQLQIALQQAVTNGFLAAGVWNGNPIGTVQTDDTLPLGFYVYGAPVASQSSAQFSTRVAPPITILGIGAGAIQGVNMALNFQ